MKSKDLWELKDIRSDALKIFKKIEDLRMSNKEVDILYKNMIALYSHIGDMVRDWEEKKNKSTLTDEEWEVLRKVLEDLIEEEGEEFKNKFKKELKDE